MNKFNAKKTTVNSITFDSKKEAAFYATLEMQKKAVKESDRVIEIVLQPRFNMFVNNKNIGFYKADFKVKYANGSEKIFDVKGLKTGSAYQLFALKKKIVEAIYNIEIIEV